MTTLLFSSLLFLINAANQPNGEALILADSGATSYSIAVDKNATDTEKFAAEELARFLSQISGADFPVVTVTDSKHAKGRMILVGPDAVSRSSDKRFASLDQLGGEGYILCASGDTLCIAGGQPRGTLYGVYDLLHYRLGCRWLAPGCSVIPEKKHLAVKPFTRRFVPALEYRATDYPTSRDALWAARNHLNGTQTHLDKKHGGKVSYHHFVHTFNSILNPAQHFKAHPEYFSERNGRRTGGRTQLCLTNPDVLAIATKTVKRWIREAPDASIFSVSQNDWHNYCQCKKCSAIAEKEGAQSGPLLRFVNAIAKEIGKTHPKVAIDTLAYQYTRKPPRITRPLPNVIVRLCSIECCFNHSLEGHPFNKTFCDDIRQWGKICKRLHIWDYVIDYHNSVQPFPNLFVLKPNIRFFIRNGVKGIYEEANYFSRGGEFAELRSYVMARTLWDPDYDTDQAIDEFVKGYYGKAAGEIRRYIDLLHKRGADRKWTCTIWTPPTHPLYGDDFILRSTALFNEAERKTAGDAETLFRVKKARLPISYLRLARAAQCSHFTGKDAAFDPSVDYQKLLDQFLQTARKAKVTHVREGSAGLIDSWAARIKQQLPEQRPFKILMVTGYDYPGHKWRETAPHLQKVLSKNGRLHFTIADDPEVLADGELSTYDTIFLHFADWKEKRPSEKAQKGLEKAVKEGTGLVAIHFACGAFQKWSGFEAVIGKTWDRKKTHDPYGEFTVKITDRTHPVTAGLADFTTKDELYFCLTGTTKIRPLCHAKSKVTKNDELMAHVLHYGRGKVFFTPLGHCVESLSCDGVIKLLEKGCIWASGGIPD